MGREGEGEGKRVGGGVGGGGKGRVREEQPLADLWAGVWARERRGSERVGRGSVGGWLRGGEGHWLGLGLGLGVGLGLGMGLGLGWGQGWGYKVGDLWADWRAAVGGWLRGREGRGWAAGAHLVRALVLRDLFADHKHVAVPVHLVLNRRVECITHSHLRSTEAPGGGGGANTLARRASDAPPSARCTCSRAAASRAEAAACSSFST